MTLPPALPPAPERRAGGGFRRWHARFGIVTAVFFLLLAVTGVALNHTETLRLDERAVRAPWLMSWYGLKPNLPSQGFRLADKYLVWDDMQWTLDHTVIARREASPIGATQIGELVFIATRNALLLFQRDGQLVERIDAASLPARPIVGLSANGKRVIIYTATAKFASEDGVDWQKLSASSPAASVPQPLPAATARAIAPLYAPSLPLERVLLDLHSGRLFGRYGPWVMDLAAVALIVLALSGADMYILAWRRRRALRKSNPTSPRLPD